MSNIYPPQSVKQLKGLAPKTNFVVSVDEMNTSIELEGAKIGSLAGKGYNIPDDFNDLLNDLCQYV